MNTQHIAKLNWPGYGDGMSQLPRVVAALAFASKKHSAQRRKDVAASPYINHPIALVDILVNEAEVTDVEVIVSAILHDTVEDTDATLDEIETHFGSVIRGIVDEVTDDKSKPKMERKRLQVEHAAHISPQAQLVKLADKISNLRDVHLSPPAGWSHERVCEYFDWAKQVTDQLRGVNDRLAALFDEAYARRPG